MFGALFHVTFSDLREFVKFSEGFIAVIDAFIYRSYTGMFLASFNFIKLCFCQAPISPPLHCYIFVAFEIFPKDSSRNSYCGLFLKCPEDSSKKFFYRFLQEFHMKIHLGFLLEILLEITSVVYTTNAFQFLQKFDQRISPGTPL